MAEAEITCAACTGGTRYETAYEQQQRIGLVDSVVCADCGAFVMNVAAHDRFHAALTVPPSIHNSAEERAQS